MSNDGIDASLGLAFSLELFKRYQQHGVLQAELPRAFGIPRRCKAFLQLAAGEVISVYLEDQHGQRYSADTESLCRLDREKGPLEWILLPQAQSLASPGPLKQHTPSTLHSPVPAIISTLNQERLFAWTHQQKEALYALLRAINGERTVEDIKCMLPFSAELVDELLRILLELHVVMFSA
ncbi:MAG TPA: hypothetical protein VGF67_14880 [Ktedonobacteraceae bacterium]